MIAGIGTDIVDIVRIAKKVDSNHYFKEHVFSGHEITYCEAQRTPAIHFAGRWAVKEAYLKAFGLQFIGNHRLSEIETRQDEHGRPFVQLNGKSLMAHEQKQLGVIHVSLSHTETQAIAFIIIETRQV